MKIYYIILSGAFLLANTLHSTAESNFYRSPKDSVGIENLDGQKVILHKVSRKETYFSLSRQYNVTSKDIMKLNKQQKLRAGNVIKIPTGMPFSMPDPSVSLPTTTTTAKNTANSELIEYKVGPKETLFSIAKRFETNVEAIQKANKLKKNSLRSGQVLLVPQGQKTPLSKPVKPATVKADVMDSVDTDTSKQSLPLHSDRYGLRQVTEKGVGVWIDDLSSEGGTMLALHKTAPIGTVIKISNPMTNRTTFAKVVGKFTENQETQGAIIVISKAAASLVGVIDRRFQIEISYGVPNE
ncbi:LysM domain-containing protein [bacterium A37T11]|nr:LysM domain-containing protein [bacterium A37T11]